MKLRKLKKIQSYRSRRKRYLTIKWTLDDSHLDSIRYIISGDIFKALADKIDKEFMDSYAYDTPLRDLPTISRTQTGRISSYDTLSQMARIG